MATDRDGRSRLVSRSWSGSRQRWGRVRGGPCRSAARYRAVTEARPDAAIHIELFSGRRRPDTYAACHRGISASSSIIILPQGRRMSHTSWTGGGCGPAMHNSTPRRKC